MAESWQRRAWAEVDLDAVSSNARLLRAVAAPAGLCAVVKADAYGHGAVPVANAAVAGGATSLAVALVEEGVVLREAGLEVPILLLSEPAAAAMGEVVARDLIPTVYTRAGVNAIRAAAARASRRVEVEVKLDSGMHRVGADPGEARRIVEQVVAAPELDYGGLWTHLAIADEPSDPFTAEQLACFEALRASLRAAGLPSPARVHAANSAGTIAHPSSRYDLVRCGISLYGYLPSRAVSPAPIAAAGAGELHPALTWKTQVSHVRELEAGERTSYGRAYELAERADIATVPVGYADGVPRSLFQGGGELLIGGRRRRVAGAVTMDQLMVDCGPDSGVRCGDEVVLIGSQGGETVSAQEWADRIGTISFEILCRIGPRLPRRHVRGTAGPL
ncbi:MAG: alanine racemase [Acidimicrobiales bacterium]|jgi:alanine racemase